MSEGGKSKLFAVPSCMEMEGYAGGSSGSSWQKVQNKHWEMLLQQTELECVVCWVFSFQILGCVVYVMAFKYFGKAPSLTLQVSLNARWR